MRRFRTVLRRFLEGVVMVLMAALTLLVVAAVIFREAGAALSWSDEVASILLAWLTYYGAALAALNRSHIGFGTLVRQLPPGARRVTRTAADALVIGFFAVTAWAGWRVLSVLGGDYLITVPWMPKTVTQSVIPIGAVLFIVAELVSSKEPEGSGIP